MIYKSLGKIPYKIFIQIQQTSDLSLLSDQGIDVKELAATWDVLYDEHLSRNNTAEGKKTLRLSREIEALETQYKLILTCCHVLKFQFDEELYEVLKSFDIHY